MVISPFGKALIIIVAFALVLTLAFTVWVIMRGREPMELAQAEGLIFWDFVRERWRAQKIARITQSQLPQSARCPNHVARALWSSTTRAIQHTWRCLRADERGAAPAEKFLPTVAPITLRQAPCQTWRYIEAATWQALAVDALQAETCRLAPLNSELPLIAVTGGESIPTPIPTTAPTIAPTASPRLTAGTLVRVSGTEGLGLRVRRAADLTAPLLYKAREGDTFRVADGPVFQDEIDWWRVCSLKDGACGWAAGDYLSIIQQ
jgi:hypothetical protein